jgi:hypothetical protein
LSLFSRAVKGVGLRPLACWVCGFESRRGHGCLYLECFVSGIEVCVGLITRPGKPYRLRRMCVWSRILDNEATRAVASWYKKVIMGWAIEEPKWICLFSAGSVPELPLSSLLRSRSLQHCAWRQSGWAGKMTHFTITEVKNAWSCTSIPHKSSLLDMLLSTHKNLLNFFYFYISKKSCKFLFQTGKFPGFTPLFNDGYINHKVLTVTKAVTAVSDLRLTIWLTFVAAPAKLIHGLERYY